MISPEFCVTLARYARWQNRQVILALAEGEAGLRRKSLQAGPDSLKALCARSLAQDLLWLNRLDGAQRLTLDAAYGDDHIDSWDGWRRDRQALDARVHDWAVGLTRPVLEGELFWFSSLDGRAVSRPCWLCVTHFFTAQTQIRGQIQALLGGQGARLSGGDLLGLPHDLDWM